MFLPDNNKTRLAGKKIWGLLEILSKSITNDRGKSEPRLAGNLVFGLFYGVREKNRRRTINNVYSSRLPEEWNKYC